MPKLTPTPRSLRAAALLASALALAPLGTQAQAPAAAAAASAATRAPMAEAEVRKLDKDAAKITLKHGEIKALGMPAMTMRFEVRDKAWLDTFKVGDKVRFQAVQEGNRYIVTEIEKAP